MNTCRVCGCTDLGDMSVQRKGRLIKYGVRHYAHAECGLKKWGSSFFDRLTDWQVTQFPYIPADRAGFGKELQRRNAECVLRMRA